MGHFVNQNPIVLEHGGVGSPADPDADGRTVESIRRAGADTGSIAGNDQDSGVGNREASKVRRNRLGAVVDPVHDTPAIEVRRAVGEYHIDLAAANHDRRGRLFAKRSVNFIGTGIVITRCRQ